MLIEPYAYKNLSREYLVGISVFVQVWSEVKNIKGAIMKRMASVKRLLDEGMDANVAALGPKSHGLTPLHLAAKGGHIKVMDELLERGANIDARTKGACGWTPLHTAAKEKNRRAIRFLVENGAFLPDNMEDTRFNPPIHYCPGLEWAYEEMKRVQQESGSSSGEGGSYSSEN
ncbi:hypothetical protein OSB04_010878 [Centaurea solstitialis]|uniref:Uncharacterized protein n=1 Tax=Centaurea solstitialis TaxID=347529 RepID=A0AA38WNK3_9ASTR|nr:hypothetical protein OSB04_010878 [Centaurea solstitialis]